MGIGTGALVAGLFGMNVRRLSFRPRPSHYNPSQLPSHLEQNPYAFAVTSGAAALIAALVSWTGLRRYAAVLSTDGSVSRT